MDKITVDFAVNIIKSVTKSDGFEFKRNIKIPNENGFIYIVTCGPHILQIGKTEAKTSARFRSLLKGARPGIHNKSFIVGLSERVFGSENEITLFASKNPTEDEKVIHKKLNSETNEKASVWFDGEHVSSIKEVHNRLFNGLLHKEPNLSGEQKKKYQEVLKIVNEGVQFKRKSGKVAKYRQGDVLVGSILVQSGNQHLISVWQEMCNQYFVYTEKFISLSKSLSRKVEEVVNLETYTNSNDNSEAQLLEFELFLEKDQFTRALAFRKTVKGSQVATTANYFFETSIPNFVFEMEKPKAPKLEEILDNFEVDSDVICLANLEKSGKKEGTQYLTYWGGCYIMVRKSSFKKKGDQYFEISSR